MLPALISNRGGAEGVAGGASSAMAGISIAGVSFCSRSSASSPCLRLERLVGVVGPSSGHLRRLCAAAGPGAPADLAVGSPDEAETDGVGIEGSAGGGGVIIDGRDDDSDVMYAVV